MKRFSNATLLAACAAALFMTGCDPDSGPGTYAYRQRMREFVGKISEYAKAKAPAFAIIPQNGLDLLAADPADEPEKALEPAADYLAAIDGVGREDVYYGYDSDNQPTPEDVTASFVELLSLAETNGVQALVTDYCSQRENMDESYAANNRNGFISFAADHRELDNIPAYPAAPYGDNTENVASLAQARNFLYLINPSGFASRQVFLDSLASARHDVILIDAFYENSSLTADEVARLKQKPQGGTRLIIAYMSIGEAEDYRYYWQSGWKPGNPAWIQAENPDWAGNYVVQYWNTEWQAVIFGNADAYLDRILAAGFDGVYLDIIDAFEYFEAQE